jgi:hypothetical protein
MIDPKAFEVAFFEWATAAVKGAEGIEENAFALLLMTMNTALHSLKCLPCPHIHEFSM